MFPGTRSYNIFCFTDFCSFLLLTAYFEFVPSCFSCVQLFSTPWMVACQPPLSMGFSRQEYSSGGPFSKGSSQSRDQTASLRSPALVGGFFTTSATWEAPLIYSHFSNFFSPTFTKIGDILCKFKVHTILNFS